DAVSTTQLYSNTLPNAIAGACISISSSSGQTTITDTCAGTVTSIVCGSGLTGGTITTSGTCALATPGASTLGGVKSLTSSSHQFFNSLATTGDFGRAQPA